MNVYARVYFYMQIYVWTYVFACKLSQIYKKDNLNKQHVSLFWITDQSSTIPIQLYSMKYMFKLCYQCLHYINTSIKFFIIVVLLYVVVMDRWPLIK